MVIYTGKDIYFEINGVDFTYAQEINFDINNGEKGLIVLGLSTIKEFCYTVAEFGGTLKTYYTTYSLLSDVLTSGVSKTLSLKFGSDSSPDWTITLSVVRYGDFTLSLEVGEPVGLDVSFKPETAALT